MKSLSTATWADGATSPVKRILSIALSAGIALLVRDVHAEPAAREQPARTEPSAREKPTFGLSFAIARAENGNDSVVDDAWLQTQIDEANRLFGPISARFRRTTTKPLAEPHGELHTRADRDALTPLSEGHSIEVFVVRELEDVDEPGRPRMGVCWTGRGGRRFIVVARTAHPTVLAHELGHFFGNPHSTVVNNLMSYSRDGAPVFLDARQASTIKTFTSKFLATGRLIDVGPAPAAP
jgi:hypothetical protein